MKRLREYRLFGGILFYCLCIITLAKCITPYKPSDITSSNGLFVVEAYILAPIGSSIKISRSNDLQDINGYEKVSNAKVTIINDRGDLIATAEENNVGEYLISNPISFIADTKYALDIVVGNEHFRSTLEEPLVTPQIDELYWSPKSDGYEVDILLSTHDPLQKTEHYLWRYEEDWEYTAQFYAPERWDPEKGSVVENTYTDNTYYCWNSDYSRSFILGDAETLQDGRFKNKVIHNLKSGGTRFSYLYSILVKQYAISYEAYKYYENLHKNVNETGGLFAPMPTEMRGNIINLANPDEPIIGYVIISTETNQRIYIDRRDVPYMSVSFYSECLLEPAPGEQDIVSTPSIAYQNGWGISTNDEKTGYEYHQLRCVDCRALGGSKNKPDFWPTDNL